MRNKILLAILVLAFLGGVIWAFVQDHSNFPKTQTPSSDESQKIEEPPTDYDPISIQALAAQNLNGTDLNLGRVLGENSRYTRYYITYNSGLLKISGIMNVPKGDGPFPILILNHGYIDPAIYTNGRGLKREQDYLAKQGFVVIHPDYRNHAESDDDPEADVNFRFGYAMDVINLIGAVQSSDLEFFDKNKIGMLGHSMGGGVGWVVMTAKPDLVDAFVLFAPVSADAQDNFDRWLVRRPEVAGRILEKYGTAEANPDFWKNISPVNFFDDIQSPIMLHHGTADADVPVAWSDEFALILQDKNKQIIYHKYEGQPHEFTTSWGEVMQRSTDFFKQNLK